jgi:hypothetical protein
LGSIFEGIAKAYCLTINSPKGGLLSSNEYAQIAYPCIFKCNWYRTQILQIEENYPKYFTSGSYYGDQYLNPRNEILRTARFTYDLWHGITKKGYEHEV